MPPPSSDENVDRHGTRRDRDHTFDRGGGDDASDDYSDRRGRNYSNKRPRSDRKDRKKGISKSRRRQRRRTSNSSSSSADDTSSSSSRSRVIRRRRKREKKHHKRSKKRRHHRRRKSNSDSDELSSSSANDYVGRRQKKRRKERRRHRHRDDGGSHELDSSKKNAKRDQNESELPSITKNDITPVGHAEQTSSTTSSYAKMKINPLPTTEPMRKRPPVQQSKGPMTQKQYLELQSQIREVVDPHTGRTRLMRGTGEIIERIVSREEHTRLNQRATLGDGSEFAIDVIRAAMKKE